MPRRTRSMTASGNDARAAEIMALRDAGVTPGGYLVALDYLLATMQAELPWLREFAGSLRSGQLE
jgi:hypothetical protein